MMAEYLVSVLLDGAWFQRRDGGRFPVDSDRFKLRLVSAPGLLIDSGVVAFEEFYDLDYERTGDCRLELGAKEWPLTMANLLEGSLPLGVTIACFVGHPADVVTWEPPSSQEQMVGTNYGTICVYDRVNRPLLAGLTLKDEKTLTRITDDVEANGFGVLRGSGGENLLTLVQCYGGVGTHGVWRGLDSNGTPVCLLADMDAMSDFEPVDVAHAPVGR